MTLEQMNYLGWDRLDEDSLEAKDPKVQKQLLKGKRAFQCRTCKDIIWVKLGYKQLDIVKEGLHVHYVTKLEDDFLGDR